MTSIVRVLIVDDSSTIRALLRQVLEEDREIRIAGLASSADEAEAMLGDCLADVMTLDINMPGMDGVTFLENLKGRYSIPVIMLASGTAHGEELRVRALRAGAVGVFDKAQTVKDKGKLIKLIKAAAHHRARLDQEDREALKG